MPKIAITAFLVALLAAGGWTAAVAQPAPSPVELLGSELHEFKTNDGTVYDVYVAFPLGYEPDGDAGYPVLYVTDAFLLFPQVAQTVRLLELGGELPPMVIIGVDNPISTSGNSPASAWTEWGAKRALNLTPTRVKSQEQGRSQQSGHEVRTGGADAFLAALAGEIIPWVEARHPVAGERGLVGLSLGGLFAAHVLFTSPSVFTHYLIGSPALYWDNEIVFKREEAYASEHEDLPARVFLSAGAEEDERGIMVSSVLRLSGSLMSRTYPGLVLKRHIFSDETHLSVGGGDAKPGFGIPVRKPLTIPNR